MERPVYVGSAQWIAATPGSSTVGMFRRTDAEGEWQHLQDGLPERSEIRAIVVHPNDDATLFVGTQVGPYRTTDGGESWTSMNLPVEQVTWSILIHPKDPNVVLCGTVDNGVFRSDDGGASWRKLNYQLPTSVCTMAFPTRVIGLAMDPANPDEIYAALEVGGLIRSLDAGATWSDCNAGLLAYTEQDG